MRDRPVWICSRCVRRTGEREVGRRFRFVHEKCPDCDDPGCGMVMVGTEHLPGGPP